MTTQRTLFAVCVLLGAAGFARACPHPQAPAARPAPGPAEIHSIHVQGNVHLLVGAGGNIAVQIGDDGVLVVDTGLAQNADRVYRRDPQAVGQADPVRAEHALPSRSHGRQRSGRQGRQQDATAARPTILAHENVLTRMSAPAGNQVPHRGVADRYLLHRGEGHLLQRRSRHAVSRRAAHTDGDSIVLLRKSDVLVAGDMFVDDVVSGDRSGERRQYPGD